MGTSSDAEHNSNSSGTTTGGSSGGDVARDHCRDHHSVAASTVALSPATRRACHTTRLRSTSLNAAALPVCSCCEVDDDADDADDALHNSIAAFRDDGKPKHASTSALLLKGLLFFCGLSVFARTEAIALQTQFFVYCLGYSNSFFAISTSLLFFPGVIVQFFQQRFDMRVNRLFGTRRAAIFRTVIFNLVTVACILVYVVTIDSKHSLGREPFLLYPLLIIVGVCTSGLYGTFLQAASMIPQHQPAFLVGCMCPFFFFLPINVGAGSLCTIKPSTTPGTPGGSGPGGVPALEAVQTLAMSPDGDWEVQWESVWAFYVAGCLLCILGMCAFLWFISVHEVRVRCRQQDEGLAHGEELEPLLQSTRSTSDSFPDDSSSLNRRTSELGLPYSAIWRAVLPQIVIMSLTTYCSTVVSAQYIQVPMTKMASLPTWLQYEYYMAAAVGIFITMRHSFRCSETTAIVAAVVRLGIIAVVFLYSRPRGHTIIEQHNDYLALCLNGLFCISHGYLYSLPYVQASAKFESEVARGRASQTINICYYTSLLLAVGTTLIVNQYG
eukprot:m.68104 g.68104  ORF g.68104 m.68104 type:complete len:554 (-) comp13877_c0_seq1:56-1717(-)